VKGVKGKKEVYSLPPNSRRERKKETKKQRALKNIMASLSLGPRIRSEEGKRILKAGVDGASSSSNDIVVIVAMHLLSIAPMHVGTSTSAVI